MAFRNATAQRLQRRHGVTSLALFGIAMGIAVVVMARASWLLGAAYVGIVVVAGWGIVYAFCAKCTCKAHCGHVLPGKAAVRFDRQPGPYTPLEYAVLIGAGIALFAPPQPWLWQHLPLFFVYWGLSGVAFAEIRQFVCRACTNVYCPLRDGTIPKAT